ncbi:geranylgeranyl reductase family protein [Alcanivorax quisquiliarum]|uniref:Protein CbrA n=1 Tax=Alcanivorax quisquiliarum TaxID=2933565 RepID=A0ABT0E3J0_9GAMM|nr:geranylgeranyl reductase family protein [Alcanivorax quisquiliarum]MCK0536386.1 geranylgeranyl reductase family protein [Alcanivorax quisquiliarum]
MKETLFDAVVIGAGPAGVSAALDLMRGGARIAVIDRQAFPRQKACAGGLSDGTLRLLKYDPAPAIRVQVSAMQVSHCFNQPVTAVAQRPVFAMTRRSEFDELGFRAVEATGCPLFICPGPHTVTQDAQRVTIRYRDFTLHSRYVVAADGAGSPTRRQLIHENTRLQALSIEADVDAEHVFADAAAPTWVDFGVVPGGYAWVFPKGDHVNVGLYTSSSRFAAGINRRNLYAYANKVLGTQRLTEIRGFPLGIDCTGSRMSSGRALFAGDAGGFAHAHTGEGIYGAVLTGQLVAAAILADLDVAQTYRQSAARMLSRCRLARVLSKPLYGSLSLTYPLFARYISSQVDKAGKRT